MFDEQKSSEHELAADLVALERNLRGMAPKAPRIDRDCMMFAAGVASAAQSGRDSHSIDTASPSWAARRFWPAAAFTMTAATILLASMLVLRNESHSTAKVVAKPALTYASSFPATESKLEDRFAYRSAWTMRPPVASGYLNARFIAVARSVGDLSSEFRTADFDNDPPSDDYRSEPATRRGLLDELLKAPLRSQLPRSRSI